MSAVIKVVTTANRTRFFHHSCKDVSGLGRLLGTHGIFAGPALVFASSLQTEVYSPKQIAYIEIDGVSEPEAEEPHRDTRTTGIAVRSAIPES